MRRIAGGLLAALSAVVMAQRQTDPPLQFTQILGRPTDHSITLSVLSPKDLDAYIEFGTKPGSYTGRTAASRVMAGRPAEFFLDRLQANTRYYYRIHSPETGAENTFHTQRTRGTTFTFGVQGDSHPERLGRMYNPDLYVRNLENVRKDRPDFYVMLGDDFNVDPLYNRGNLNADTVAQLYINQRQFLAPVAASTALFLVNGNHEQAAAIHLNSTPDNPAVYAGKARNRYFPLPAPDTFYSGDPEEVQFLGFRRDYYAWTWGDALFVTIDPYWHSPAQVDAGIGGGQGQQDGRGGQKKGGQKKKGGGQRDGRARNGWDISMGDAQYHWLEKTLADSRAKFKFVFTHHVSGTGRGAIEVSDLWEWGGRNRAGEWEFDKKRPGWAMPVHELLVRNGVTILFQGHDHLFAHQERDGVVYQETPNPADDTYTAFFKEAYRSGDILPNSGYLRVTVSPADAKVEYVRAFLAKDETAENKNGGIAFAYTVSPRDRVKAIAHLPDTGQTRHFADDDDSDHPMNPIAYTVSTDGTVTDRVTGLLWQHTDGGEMTWEAARDYCAALTLAGKFGWRLPSNQELFGILNHNNGKPAIDTSAFTRTGAEYWWSSDIRADDAARIWTVNEGGGTGPHPKRETISAGGPKRYHVRCVNGEVPHIFSERYKASGDGTVTDNRTGLVWQQGETKAMTWEEALVYARSLSLAGQRDWRVPNIKELESLNNESIVRPSIPKLVYPGASGEVYWSSTTLVNHPSRAWTVDFEFGIASYEEKTEKLLVRAVRGKR